MSASTGDPMAGRDRGRSLAACGILLLVAATASGQGRSTVREPQLPGAVTRAPAWLGNAPFDVSRLFEMPPASQNAAPLYLDAFFDFGGDMAICFPPDRRGRAATAEANGLRIDRAHSAWDEQRDPTHLDRAEIDALAVVMHDALRKLDTAQQRPRCVFAEGIAYDVPVPHSQVSRRVVKLWSLLAVRALDRGDLDGAIGYVQRILRLSQDLRPRGAAIDQLIGTAFDAIACNILIPRILAHPRFQASHCDRLLALLKGHEARIADSFAIGVKTTYIMERVMIRTFEERVAPTIDANGRAVEKTLDADGLARYFLQLVSDIVGYEDPSKRIDPEKLNDPGSLELARKQIREMRLNFAKEHLAADEWARCMLSLPTIPYAQRIARVEAVIRRYDPRSAPVGQSAHIFVMTLPNFRHQVDVAVRDALNVAAAQCLIAVRRWQLSHQGQVAGLSEACRAAGLGHVPIDGYRGSPLRMAVIAGDPVIYSVGPDGDDDGGLKDADFGRNPDGDFLYRLPGALAGSRR